MAEESRAHATIKKYMYWSMGAGLIPVPMFDVTAVMAIQLKMIGALARQYKQEFSRESGKAFLASLVGGALPTTTAMAVASATKSVPLIGQAAGALGMSVFAGASTYATGRVFVQHFESGRTFQDFDPDAAQSSYAEEFENGKAAIGK